MHPHPDWFARNVTLRQLGLPVMEDVQHEALARIAGLADQFDQRTHGLLGKMDGRTWSYLTTCGNPEMRWVAAVLAEVAWRAPARSPDLGLDQMALLNRMQLICRDTLELMKSRPPVVIGLRAVGDTAA